jgi:hypothetical protein
MGRVARPMKWRHLYREGTGWLVKVRRKRRVFQRRFGDRTHGGRERGLAAAVAWRDALLRRVGPATMIRKRFSPNKTGVIGVQLTRDRTRQGRPAPRYRPSWYELDGRLRMKSFSVNTYGALRAKALAAAVRKAMVRRVLAERRRLLRARLGLADRFSDRGGRRGW